VKTDKGIPKHIIFCIVAFCMVLPRAFAETYPVPGITGPGGSVGFPESFAPFDPPVSGSAVAGAPEIAEWARSNEPGDTLVLTAERLEAGATRFVFNAGGSGSYSVPALRESGRMAAVEIPPALPAAALYLMWPGNSSGYGEPVAINQAEAWWVGFDKVSRGDVFSIYGRNLVLDNGGECHLYITGHGWISSDTANPYKADFTVPSNLANGTYTVYAHNGQGRQYGFSAPLTLTVESAYVWNSRVYNVVDYGANGSDLNPDDAGIAAAISASKSDPGSTVYLPGGTYYVSSHVHFGGRTRVAGEGMGVSIIRPHATYSSSEALFTAGNGAALRDLSFYSDTPLAGGTLAHIGWKSGMVFDRVEFTDEHYGSAGGPSGSLLRCNQSRRNTFNDCRFGIGEDLYLGDAENLRFNRCTFIGMNDVNQMVTYKGAHLWSGVEQGALDHRCRAVVLLLYGREYHVQSDAAA
jgi:hypothetical protein